jgi:heptosyltransferase III
MLITPDEAKRAKRVLIINVTRIGDTLLATPAVRAIAHHFPNANITCLAHPARYSVLQGIPYLSKVGSISKKNAWLRGWKDKLTGSPEYDYAFVWGQDTALVRYACRKARYVVAEQQSDIALNQLLHTPFVAPVQNTIHAVAWFLSMVTAVGIAPRGYSLDIAISPVEIDAAKTFLHSHLGGVNFPIIGFQVASFATKAWRDWPIQRFIELGVLIIEQYPEARFVCFGSAQDRARIEELSHALLGRVVNLAGKTSLRETAAIMTQLSLYVGIDTGPTHLFSTLKKPMVALYHPAIPSALYKPLEHPALHVVDHPAAAPDCRDRLPMSDIAADRVWQSVQRALDGKSPLSGGMQSPGVDATVAPWPGDVLPLR